MKISSKLIKVNYKLPFLQLGHLAVKVPTEIKIGKQFRNHSNFTVCGEIVCLLLLFLFSVKKGEASIYTLPFVFLFQLSSISPVIVPWQ